MGYEGWRERIKATVTRVRKRGVHKDVGSYVTPQVGTDGRQERPCTTMGHDPEWATTDIPGRFYNRSHLIPPKHRSGRKRTKVRNHYLMAVAPEYFGDRPPAEGSDQRTVDKHEDHDIGHVRDRGRMRGLRDPFPHAG